MQIYDSQYWINDIDKIISSFPEIIDLSGKTVMITGATGLICSGVTDILIRYNETHEATIGIVVAGRDEGKAKQRFGQFFDRDYFRYTQYDASKSDNMIELDVDYIIHGASNASPTKIVGEPVESMLSNIIGVQGLLDYSLEHNVSRLLFISSSEVYGKKEDNRPYTENDYGYIDLLNSRNSYSVGKRAAETLCKSYMDEYGVNFVIVRPGHIYGPTALPDDNRVSSAWAYSAVKGEDIVMKSSGVQLRSYCYCLDCASAILKVLLRGENGEAYNISNPDSIISIRQLAELYALYGGVEIESKIPTEQEKAAFNPMSNSSLDSEKLQNLGWKGNFDSDVGVEHTIMILKEILMS